MSIIDLSEAGGARRAPIAEAAASAAVQQKVVPAETPAVTFLEIQAAMVELKATCRILLDKKFALLRQLGATTQIPGLVGVKDPRTEIVEKLKFMDNNWTRLKDLIHAAGVIIQQFRIGMDPELANKPEYLDLREYPEMVHHLNEVARAVVDAVTKPEDPTDNERKLMIFGFAELWRKHVELGL